MGEQSNYFISGDWGTSRLRLQVVEREGLASLVQWESEQGIKASFAAWQQSGMPRGAFFSQILHAGIQSLAQQWGQEVAGLPLVLSGMASSSIGLKELPYANLPFPLDGSQLSWEMIPARQDFPHPVSLISGLAKMGDVMRGEEVQAVGAEEALHAIGGDALLLLPGTHSKHLHIMRGVVVDFHTYMTGELYEVLLQHSILAQDAGHEELSKEQQKATFLAAVRLGHTHGFSQSVFSIRANRLQGNFEAGAGKYALSGLLIGSELNQLAKQADLPIVLAAGPGLREKYEWALEELGKMDQTQVLEAEVVARLSLLGQARMLG
jgi:2-dehydro-3-deoxygalactonokinase